jgi:hypothetical protein
MSIGIRYRYPVSEPRSDPRERKMRLTPSHLLSCPAIAIAIAIEANFNIHGEEKTPNNSHKYFRARGRNRRGNRRYLKTLGENSNKRAEALDRRSSSRGFRRASPLPPGAPRGAGATILANYKRSNVTGTKLPRGKRIVGARRNRCE